MNVIRPITVGDGGSFSRASTKTCIGPDGLLMTVPVDMPAWQYDPLNLSAAPVVLLEGAATNLLLNSEGGTSTLGPQGEVTNAPTSIAGFAASIKFPSTPTTVAYAHRNATTTAAQYTLSVFMAMDDGLAPGQNDFTPLVQGNTQLIQSISPVGNGVYRVTSTAICTAGGAIVGIVKYINQSARGFRVTGYQLELGAVSSSYIPTTSAPVTRAADIITGTGLIWSNALETAPTTYAGGTTYAKNDQVSVAGVNGALDCYVSLQAANIGHAPTSSPAWWSYQCTTYAPYSSGATYALNDQVIDPVAHLVYTSLVAANTGNALTDSTKWYTDNTSSTNRFAAFDSVVGTAATMPKALLMLIVPGAIDSIGLENISASSAAISMTDVGSMTQVFSKITGLTNDTSITDYDQYFFDPVDLVSGLYVDGLPPYYSGTLGIALTGPATVSLGVAVVGNTFDLGGAQYGARVGFISYSKKVTDVDGNMSVKKGAVSKRMSMTAMIDNTRLDKTVSVMEELDGIPTIYVGAGNLYSCLIQYGFTKEFDTEIAYPTNSLCSYQFEGLI